MTTIHILPKRFTDERGWFSETWHELRYSNQGIHAKFCQDNHSLSRKSGTIRGLHFQMEPSAQAKLVRCVRGEIFDVAVDIRRESPTFGQWIGVKLSAETGNQLFIPVGYAHGFQTLRDDTEVAYKVDAYYVPELDGGIYWNDSSIGINWPLPCNTSLLSAKDASLPLLAATQFEFQYDGMPLLQHQKDLN